MIARNRKILKGLCAVAALAVVTVPVLMACFDLQEKPSQSPSCAGPNQTQWNINVPIQYKTDVEDTILKWYVVEKPLSTECADVTAWGDSVNTKNDPTLDCNAWHDAQANYVVGEAANKSYCWKVEMTGTGHNHSMTGEVLCPGP